MTDPMKRYDEELQKGAFPDLPERVTPFFSNLVNAKIREGAAQPLEGKVPLFSKPQAAEPTRGIASAEADNGPSLYFGTLSDLYYWAATATDGAVSRTATTIGSASATAYSGKVNSSATAKTEATVWSFSAWGSWMAGTNGLDPVQYDTGSGFATLKTATGGDLEFDTAEILVTRDPFMLVFNTTSTKEIDGDKTIRWCDRDDLQEWTATSLANFAGARSIRGVDGGWKAAIGYAGEVIGFSSNAAYFVSFIGAPRVFAVSRLARGIGCLSKQAVAELDGRLFGFGPAGLWAATLDGYDYIDKGTVHDLVFDDINMEQAKKIVVCANPVQKTIAFHYPSGMSLDNDKSVVYNAQENNWSSGTTNVSACDKELAIDEVVVGNKVGDIFVDGPVGGLAQQEDAGQLQHTTTGSVTLGFGEGGFGQLGFGGFTQIDG